MLTGTGVLILGSALLGVAIGMKSLPLLLIGGVLAGASQGLSFRSALGAVTSSAPPAQRGMVASSFFAICYVGISLPVVAIGAASDRYGLVHTGEVFGGVVAAISLAALVALSRQSGNPAE
jgi:predicted MFS family arabinose efflux permease